MKIGNMKYNLYKYNLPAVEWCAENLNKRKKHIESHPEIYSSGASILAYLKSCYHKEGYNRVIDNGDTWNLTICEEEMGARVEASFEISKINNTFKMSDKFHALARDDESILEFNLDDIKSMELIDRSEESKELGLTGLEWENEFTTYWELEKKKYYNHLQDDITLVNEMEM